jgi:hypothetical protein
MVQVVLAGQWPGYSIEPSDGEIRLLYGRGTPALFTRTVQLNVERQPCDSDIVSRASLKFKFKPELKLPHHGRPHLRTSRKHPLSVTVPKSYGEILVEPYYLESRVTEIRTHTSSSWPFMQPHGRLSWPQGM